MSRIYFHWYKTTPNPQYQIAYRLICVLRTFELVDDFQLCRMCVNYELDLNFYQNYWTSSGKFSSVEFTKWWFSKQLNKKCSFKKHSKFANTISKNALFFGKVY